MGSVTERHTGERRLGIFNHVAELMLDDLNKLDEQHETLHGDGATEGASKFNYIDLDLDTYQTRFLLQSNS